VTEELAVANDAEETWTTVDFAPLDQALHDDFWQSLTSVREQCPVGWTTSQWSLTESGQWIINDYENVMDAATHWEKFSSAGGVSSVQMPLDLIRLIPVETDPPVHRDIRKALNPFFTPAALAQNDHEIGKVVDSLIDDCLAQEGSVDFTASFTSQLPPIVFLGPGFLDQGIEQANRLIELISILLTQPELTMEAAPKLLAWCADLLETRRAEGRRDDLAGSIAHMGFGEGGLELSERERIETINLAVMAGMETTMGGLGTVAWLLATRPALRAQLETADDRFLEQAIDEFMRFATPVPTSGRTLAQDVEVRGCPMKSGDRVLVNWAAANLDPEQFPDPLTIDFNRDNVSSHMAFGAGIHRCLGSHLARREIKASIRAICALEQFELVPGHEIKFRAAFARGPVSIPVLMKR
jgi:cytochrome P450